MSSIFIEKAERFLWGPPMLTAFVGVGMYFTFRSGFFQIRGFKLWFVKNIKEMLRGGKRDKGKDKNSISRFQALSGALAACMGTGNIVGVATALSAGGPGALLWMEISAFFGMMTAYVESVLGIKYRRKNKRGEWLGGAMTYIEDGLGAKRTASIYAFLLASSSFGIGSMTQVNSASSSLSASFGISPYFTGAVFCVLTAFFVFGGIKRTASLTEKLVPFVVAVFILSSLVVLAVNIERIPDALKMIFREAFSFGAAAKGCASYGIGKAARYGIARGVFSNEAGLGTSSIIHSAADTDSPESQGMLGMLEVFIDTVLMCTLTGLVILVSGAYSPGGALSGAALYGAAFASVFGKTGGMILSVTVTLLAFASLCGWSYYGEKGAEYVFSVRFVPVYRLLFVLSAFVGAVMKLTTVWSISDILNSLMAVPNLISTVLLSDEAFCGFNRDKKPGRQRK
ncbi:MAG: sodium:alanine symporter family protein [Clostridiales bacterium]|nr:sodium:alanine symporter family protein [Clostridiales bacterium]